MPKITTCAAWADKLLRHATVLKPDGPGPHPVALQLHGCAGPRPFERLYAESAVAAGVAVVMIDSAGPRGFNQLTARALVCTGTVLKGARRAADLFAIQDWVRHQPWADGDRIFAAGWSHGGWTIMDALAAGADAPRLSGLSDLPADPLAGLKGVAVVYPYAGPPALTISRGWQGLRPPTYALLCGKDVVVGVKAPMRALNRLEADGVVVHRLFLDDATHAFDDDGAYSPLTKFRADHFDRARRWYVEALEASFAA
jgi:dienelactone hydrolase